MCGRFALADPDPRLLGDRFDVRPPAQLELRPRYNIAPTDPVLIVRDGDGGRRAEMARWDLFGSSQRGRAPLINVRADRVLDRASLRSLLDRAASRALMPADAFYEWLAAERPGEPKLPVRYGVDGGAPFAFAALRSGGERSEKAACALFTATANALVAPVHDRMPVILPDADAEAAWLDPALDAPAAAELLRPLAPERMTAAAASRRVGDVRSEGPELWEPGAADEQATLF